MIKPIQHKSACKFVTAEFNQLSGNLFTVSFSSLSLT